MRSRPVGRIWCGMTACKPIVHASNDEGRTFTYQRPISDEPAAYSDLTVLKDKSAGVLRERGDYRFIPFTRLDREFLEPAP